LELFLGNINFNLLHLSHYRHFILLFLIEELDDRNRYEWQHTNDNKHQSVSQQNFVNDLLKTGVLHCLTVLQSVLPVFFELRAQDLVLHEDAQGFVDDPQSKEKVGKHLCGVLGLLRERVNYFVQVAVERLRNVLDHFDLEDVA
jgi:hypothetical protein